jgi:hypothetical protein
MTPKDNLAIAEESHNEEADQLGPFDTIISSVGSEKEIIGTACDTLKDPAKIKIFIKDYAKYLTTSRRDKWISSSDERVIKIQEATLQHMCYDLVKSIWLCITAKLDNNVTKLWLDVFKELDKDPTLAPQHYLYDLLADYRARILKEMTK